MLLVGSLLRQSSRNHFDLFPHVRASPYRSLPMIRIKPKRATGENMAQPQQRRPISLTLHPLRPLREVQLLLCDPRYPSRVGRTVLVLVLDSIGLVQSNFEKRFKNGQFRTIFPGAELIETYGRFRARPAPSNHASATASATADQPLPVHELQCPISCFRVPVGFVPCRYGRT